MITIRNLTTAPIRVHLFGGKLLHLGPGKTAQVPRASADLDSFRRLLAEHKIARIDDVDGPGTPGARTPGESVSTHGHPQPHRSRVAGNR